MEMLYHGTHFENGIAIARAGFILSPWYKELERLRKLYEGNEDFLRNIIPVRRWKMLL
ncbi:MAG: hypothetical protein ABH864_07100 [archaeon]